METIRILFYTDKSNISTNCNFWGLTSVEQFVHLKLRGLADVKFTTRNRHFDYATNQEVNGATPLNSTLLQDFDEIWVFGARQANTKTEPYNELDLTEISALREWMKEGGMMITGDHSDALGLFDCSSEHKDFVNLGAAIGQKIPRAGDLRTWKGPPTGCYEGLSLELRDNHNTQEGDHRGDLDLMHLQSDKVPQELRLTSGTPHRLFWWSVDSNSQTVIPITVFPDHIHEGDLKIPLKMEGEWPSQSAPPIVVAWGRDKRFPKEGRYYKLVSAYDGDSGYVGRIVADSSFHHYIDRNLLRIPARTANRDPEPGSPLDQIAQYYANLALWLAPRKIRERLAWGLFYWSASHPDVLEEKSSGPLVLGRTAINFLNSDIGSDNLHRLLACSELEHGENRISGPFSQIFLPTDSQLRIESENVLGHVIKEYHHHFAEIGLSDPGCRPRRLPHTKIILQGLENALSTAEKLELLKSFRDAAKHYDRLMK